ELNTRIALGVFAAYVCRCIGRTVVRNQKCETGIILREQCIQRFTQIGGSIVDRHSDGQKGNICTHYSRYTQGKLLLDELLSEEHFELGVLVTQFPEFALLHSLEL